MRKFNITAFFILIISLTTLSSCEIAGDIFKAGMWFAVLGIALVVGLVFYIMAKVKGK